MAQTNPGPSAGGAPDATPERRLAYQILSQESGLWAEILYELLGHPQRYSELKPLLGDQAENTLTYALDKLVDEGLVKRTSDVVDDDLVKQYAISRKGIDVFLHIHLLETIDRFASASGFAERSRERLQTRVKDVSGILESQDVLVHPASGLIESSVLADAGPLLRQSENLALAEELSSTLGSAQDELGVGSKELSYITFASEGQEGPSEGRVYHVRPTGEGTWSLKREGAEKATKNYDQPRLAVARGLELAGENGKVFVHDASGEVEMVFDAPTTEIETH